VEMPNINGFDLLSIIRNIRGYEETPIIFLTGNASEENVRRAINNGANDFIAKPVNAQLLRIRVQKYLG